MQFPIKITDVLAIFAENDATELVLRVALPFLNAMI